MEKTTSLDQLKRSFPNSQQQAFQQPFPMATSDEPTPVPLDEDIIDESSSSKKETMNNIIHYFEEMQQPPVSAPAPSPLPPIEYVQTPPTYVSTRTISPLKTVLRMILLFFLLMAFFTPKTQQLLRNFMSSMYQVNGTWNMKGMLIISGVISVFFGLFDFGFSRFV